MLLIRSESVVRRLQAISFKPSQNASSRLTLVLCPARTIERFTIGDFIAAGFVVALLLFWVRYRHRIFYGAIEILAGIFTLWQQYPTGRGSFSGWFAEAFQRYDWHVVF